MVYILDGTAEQAMTAFFAHLQRANAGEPGADNELRDAMASLVWLHDRQAAVGPVAPERLAQFRRESAEALARTNAVQTYVLRALFLAEGTNDNQWYELSMRRSVIQSLLDDYAGTPIPDLIEREDVAELDEELRRIGQDDEQGVTEERFYPRGLPDSHWWWRYPEQFK
jgi:hypothetical protein